MPLRKSLSLDQPIVSTFSIMQAAGRLSFWAAEGCLAGIGLDLQRWLIDRLEVQAYDVVKREKKLRGYYSDHFILLVGSGQSYPYCFW